MGQNFPVRGLVVAMLVGLGACTQARRSQVEAGAVPAPNEAPGATLTRDASAQAEAELPTAGEGAGAQATASGQSGASSAPAPESAVDAGSGAGEAAPPGADLCGLPAQAPRRTYAVDSIHLPGLNVNFVDRKPPFARDINGDGETENAYGEAARYYGQSFHWQAAMDLLVSSGRMDLRVELAATDLPSSMCATVELSPSSSDSALGGDAGAVLLGSIADDALDASLDDDAVIPGVELLLPMGPPVGSTDDATWPGVATVALTVVHVTFTVGDDALVEGQLNGFISAAELEERLIPALAANMTAMGQGPMPVSDQILNRFDTGGVPDPACGSSCRDRDGACAVAGDGVISDCEVATSTSGASLLVPDVQMFGADGRYDPSPDNERPDSFSVGLAFTAIATDR